MDFGESDDEGLPTYADSTSGSLEDDPNTSSSSPSSGLVDTTLPIQEPPSPGTARKRANEEIYEKSQRPLPSTTPLKPPPSFSFEDRVSTEPQQSAAWKVSFKESQPTVPTHLSPTMAETIGEPPTQANTEVTIPKTFIGSVATYQKHLDDEFEAYENELKSRERFQELRELDWQDLEDRYQKEISLRIADEEAIMREFQERFAVSYLDWYISWLIIFSNSCCGCKSRGAERVREESRGQYSTCCKRSMLTDHRLRTRVAFVQHSEGRLGDRQEHCESHPLVRRRRLALT